MAVEQIGDDGFLVAFEFVKAEVLFQSICENLSGKHSQRGVVSVIGQIISPYGAVASKWACSIFWLA